MPHKLYIGHTHTATRGVAQNCLSAEEGASKGLVTQWTSWGAINKQMQIPPLRVRV